MKLTAELRDEILREHFEEWLKAYTSKDKKLMYTVQLKTVNIHGQRCNCTTKAVMNKLKTMYTNIGLFTN